ncbi:Ankyrin repeat and sterile alpha motif domain-containing protein 1B [Nymphon striatum]|nr:Ankyrin repeat and sterile alpha motif domain-containing protein 1B [Nymphon striatum]
MGKDQDLIEAARSGNLGVVERILNNRTKRTGPLASLRRGPGANVQDNCGYTSLHHSALNGHKEIVELLLTHEASTNVVDHKGSSPLHLAAWTGNTEIVKLLLSHGPSVPNVSLMNHDSETALHCAAQYGHTEAVSLLLQHKCDPTVRNMKGESPLDLAAQYGRLETVNVILKAHPELIRHYVRTHSPLHLASRNGHKQVVQTLLDAGIDVNLQTENGTALQEASLYGKTEIVKVLLKNGVDVDAIDTRGRTVFNIVNDLNTHVARQISKVIKNHCTLVSTSESVLNESGPLPMPRMVPSTPPPGDIYQNVLVPKRVSSSQRRRSNDQEDGHWSSDMHRIQPPSRPEMNRRLSGGSDHFHSPNTHHSSCEDSDVSSQYQTPPPPPAELSDRHSISSHEGSNKHSSSLPPGGDYNAIIPSSLPPIESNFSQLSDPECAVYAIPPAPKEFRNDYKSLMSTSAPSAGRNYLHMEPVPPVPLSKPQFSKPPAKPPRRSVNPISPTKLNEISRQGGTVYEYLCLATSGEPKSGNGYKESNVDQYVDMSLPANLTGSYENSDIKPDAKDDDLENGIYGHIVPRNHSNSNGNIENNFSALYDDIASGKTGGSMFKLTSNSSKSTPVLNRTKISGELNSDDDRPNKPTSLDIMRSKRATVNLPLSPTGYDQPPTPDHPPPSPATAVAGIHEKMRPLSKDLTNNRLSRDNETLTEEEYFSLEDSLDSQRSVSVSTVNKCISTENIEKVVEDTPYAAGNKMSWKATESYGKGSKSVMIPVKALEGIDLGGLFRGSSKAYLHMIGNRYDDVKLRVTVQEKTGGKISKPVYENVLVESDTGKMKLESSVKPYTNNTNSSSVNNSVVVMSPFDENAEWAEIANIFASFGSGMARESVFMRDMQDKFADSLSSSSGNKKNDSSDSNEDQAFETVGDWLNHLEINKYLSLLINNGFDNIKFMGGKLVEEQHLIDIGISNQEHRKKILQSYETFAFYKASGGNLIEEQDLIDIGISNQEHRKKILKSSKHLPSIKPVSKENNEKGVLKIKPESVDEWLRSVQLEQYCDAFHKNDYSDMYRVMKVWEVELNTVLEIHKIGHRKRILASLGERIANQYMNLPDVDVKDLDVDLSRLNLDTAPSPTVAKEPSLFRDYTNLKPVPPPRVPPGWKSSKVTEPKLELQVRPPAEVLEKQPENQVKDKNIGIRSPAELFSGIPTSLTTQWRHDPNKLIHGCCNYTAQYLGSTLVKELKGMESTVKSIQKLKKSTKEIGKIPNVVLSMSHKGVKFIDAHSKKMVCAHEIQNIHCACQDADDLNHFAYITKDHSTNHHYCHVFSVTSMDLATEIILTLGEAFEVAYQMALQEKGSNKPEKPSKPEKPEKPEKPSKPEGLQNINLTTKVETRSKKLSS